MNEEAARRKDPPDESDAKPPGMREITLEMAARIDEVLDEAERSALRIQREAEESAERYLAARRREIDDRLADYREQVDRDAQERAVTLARIGHALRRAAERVVEEMTALERETEQAAEAAPGISNRPEPSLAGIDAARTGAEPTPADPADGGAGEKAFEAALLRAAQLAAGGSSRDEIDRLLTEEFGPAIPDEVLAEIFDRRP